MKMRKHHCARLKHAKGQIFTCGMFGTCSDSVLSPRTPPPALVISGPLPPAAGAAAPPPPPPPPAPAATKTTTTTDSDELKPKPLAEVLALPPSPDTVAQEKILSQWDFGLKQQMSQLREKESEMIKAAAAAAVAAAAPLAKKTADDHAGQDNGFFKERYVGLVDRDLSPFQSSRPAAAAAQPPPLPAAPPPADQSLDALTKDTACGRFAKASLRSLRVLADESERNKRAIVAAGVPDSLISLLLSTSPEIEKKDILREALALLATLADEEHTQELITQSGLLAAIEADLRRRSTDAWILLCKLSAVESAVDPAAIPVVLGACVSLLKDPSAEAKLVRLALKSMLGICLSKPNRVPAVQAGAVEALLETLVDLHGVDGGEFCSKNGIVVNVERALATLELLCTSTEGRAAICSQPNFISELVGLVLGVSERATEYAAGVLCAVLCDNLGSDASADGTGNGNAMANSTSNFRFDRSAAAAAAAFGAVEHSSVQELAVKGGAPAQMLLVMQSDCSDRARRKAAKLLKALHKYGENHSTIHSDLASTITY